MQKLKTLIVTVLTLALAFGLVYGVNLFAAPIIEANESSAAFEPLYAVLPEAKGFELLYSAADPAAGSLDPATVGEDVQALYRETSGQGFATLLSTTKGYTGEPIQFTLAIDGQGTITAVELTNYPETKDFGVDVYPGTYVGENSTLANVQLVAGVTFSSSAFKGAVGQTFDALVANELIRAAAKSDEQVLWELLPVAAPGMATPLGIPQVEEIAEPGAPFLKAWHSLTGRTFAFLAEDGGRQLLAVGSVNGSVGFFDASGALVDADSALAEAVRAYVAEHGEPITKNEEGKLLRASGAESAEPLALENVFNGVAAAYRLSDGNYGFIVKNFGYSNEIMTEYFVLDPNGAVVIMTADEIILFKEYFTGYTLEEAAYKAGFAGLTAETYNGEQALISGATMSTNAIDQSARDVFAAFESMKQGGMA